MLVLFLPAIWILLWIVLGAVAVAVVGTVWVLCTFTLWLMDLKPRLTGRKNAASSKPTLPGGRSSRNAPPGPSMPKLPLKPAPGSEHDNPPAPKRPAAETRVASDIWPKWTPSRRREVDRELALWQEQFDALNSPKQS